MRRKINYFYNIRGIEFIYRGNTSDPILRYKRYYFNYYDIEDVLNIYYQEAFEDGYTNASTLDDFIAENHAQVSNWLKCYIQDCIHFGYKFTSIEKLVASY